MNDFEKELLNTFREELNKKDKHQYTIIIVLVVAIFLSTIGLVVQHGMTLLYLYQYDFSTEVTTTVEQDAGDGGNANYINGDGDIVNGKTNGN